MIRLGQCCDGYFRDVFCIDKGLGDVTHGERQFSLQNRLKKVRLAEVLAKPAGSQDSPVDPTVLHNTFSVFRFDFTAPGEQHQCADALFDSQVGEGPNGFQRTRDGEVGLIGKVDRLHPVQHGIPGRSIFPVKGWIGVSRAETDRYAKRLKTFCDPPAGFACGAEYQHGFLSGFHRGHLHRLM